MYFMSIRLLYSKLFLLTGCILAASFFTPTKAQVIQSQRFEVNLDYGEEPFDVVSADQSVFMFKTVAAEATDAIEIFYLDSALTEKWKGFIPLEPNYFLIGKKAKAGKLYLLFRYVNYSNKDLLLFIVDPNGTFVRHVIKGYIPFSPADFEVSSQAILVGGYYNRTPLVLHFSLATLRSLVLPGSFTNVGDITQIKVFEDDTFDVLISALNENRRRTIMIKTYSADGTLLHTHSLDPGFDRHLIFGRSVSAGDQRLIAGVYGSRSAEYSHGIFVARINPDGAEQIQYYHFGDLENFFSFMKAKRQQRVKERIERRKIKGKKVRLHYRFLVDELLFHNGQYVMLGEAFYPKYKYVENSTFMTGPVMGRMGQNGRIFDGYFYTHAVVIGFAENGKLLWDNSFEINDIRTFKLEQFVKIQPHDEEIALLYLYENNIRSKIIQDSEVVEGKSTAPVLTGDKNDVVEKGSSSAIGRIQYWYDDYMLASGIQGIANAVTNKRRRVFFVNKIQHRKL